MANHRWTADKMPDMSGRVVVVTGASSGIGVITADPIDACVVLLAEPGDRILTSDPDDLLRLAAAAGNHAVIITC